MIRPLSYLPVFGAASCFLLVVTSFAGADEPKHQNTAAATIESHESLDVQLAMARLNLAKLELERALAANERMPGSYTPITIELLRRNVDIVEVRLDTVSRPGETKLHAAHLRELESSLKIAELRWKIDVRLRKRLPGSIDASQVEAQRLRAEVARLALARARDPARVATPMVHMQWQLEQLRQELLELTLRVQELSNRN